MQTKGILAKKPQGKNRNSAVVRNLTPTAAFAVPAAIMFGVFTLFPCLIGVLTSFTNWNGITFDLSKIDFIGIKNYIRMFTDRHVIEKITFTVTLTVVLTVIENIIGLLLGVMMRKTGRFTAIVRCLIYIPGVLSAIAMAFLWKAMLNYVGVINSTLNLFGLEDFLIHAFDTPTSCTICIIIVHVWSAVGYYMIMYLSALQGIPSELYESAMLDGANSWHQLISITVPLIVPQIIICVMLSLINNMAIYEMILTLTSGGPGEATRTFMFAVYQEGMEKWRVGYASALSVAFGTVIFVLNRFSRGLAKKLGVEQ